MTTRTARHFCSLLVLAIGGVALAQPGPGGPPGDPNQDRGRQQARKRDGSGPNRPMDATANPASNRLERIFNALDADGDGKINKDEMAQKGPGILKALQAADAGQPGPRAAQRGPRSAQRGPQSDQRGPGSAQRGPGAERRGPGAARSGADADGRRGSNRGFGRGFGPGFNMDACKGCGRSAGRGMGAGWDRPAGRGLAQKMQSQRGFGRSMDAKRPGPRFGRGGPDSIAGRGFGQGRGGPGRGFGQGQDMDRDDGPHAFQPPARRGGFDGGFNGPRGPYGRSW